MTVDVCGRVGASPAPPEPRSRVGIALGTSGWPINGLRHPLGAGTNGWFLWRGAVLPRQEDAFAAMHVEHLAERLPEALPYLALPTGWRFLVAPGHEDVWFDDSLLDV